MYKCAVETPMYLIVNTVTKSSLSSPRGCMQGHLRKLDKRKPLWKGIYGRMLALAAHALAEVCFDYVLILNIFYTL